MRCLTALLALSLATFSFAAPAQDLAGFTTRAQQDAFQKTGFFPETMYKGDPVYREASLYTDALGSMDVRLKDGTKLTLAPNSRITVDSFVYDPTDSSGEMLVELGKGALRFVSGRVRKERVSLQTPVATIGIRGTAFTLQDTGTGRLNIWLDEGGITASPVNSDQSFDFDAPVFATCTSTACETAEAPDRPATYPEGDSDDGRSGADGDSGGGDGGQ